MNAEDKYEYIAGVEAADADTFAELLLNASDEETAILRTHLGNALHQRLHRLATRQRIARASGNLERGTLIVVPGILGSQLTTTIDGKREHVWMNLSHLVAGHFVHLQLDESGRDEANPRIAVNATGILKRYYGELLLTLAIHWDVHAFWYDWRMDFELIASELHALVARLYGDNEPIYLVAQLDRVMSHGGQGG